jgi:hypothetical protein
MTLTAEVYEIVRYKSGLTEAQIARMIFGRDGYAQQVNRACRMLFDADRLERRGRGTSG